MRVPVVGWLFRVVPPARAVGDAHGAAHPQYTAARGARHGLSARAGPRLAAERRADRGAEAGMDDAPGPATILIVEDDAATSAFLVDVLRDAGYHTLVAALGRAALAELGERAVDLVLLDWWLPDMDEVAVCRQIRATLDATLPIVVLTADARVELAATARDAGVTAYLRKPLAPAVLLDQVAALVRGAGAGPLAPREWARGGTGGHD